MPSDRIENNENRSAENQNSTTESCLREVHADRQENRSNTWAGDHANASAQRSVQEHFGDVEIVDPDRDGRHRQHIPEQVNGQTPHDSGVGQNIGPHLEPLGPPVYPGVEQHLQTPKSEDLDVYMEDMNKRYYMQHPSEVPQWQPAGGSSVPPVYQHLRRSPQH